MLNIRKIALLVCFLATTTCVCAQDCETMLEAANAYYGRHEYSKAKKMYEQIINQCDDNYGGARQRLQECKNEIQKQQEDAVYRKCSTIEACEYYLSKYPQGRYVSRVNQIRDSLYYMPRPRPILVDDSHKWEEAEEEAYSRCTTEEACQEYLLKYPNGEHYQEIYSRLEEFKLERLRREQAAAKTAYMTVRKIEFANSDASGNLLSNFGLPLYDSEIKYLKTRIVYDGILDESKHVQLYFRIITPDGTLEQGTNSPTGYTYSKSVWVMSDANNTILLPGWGNATGNTFTPGNYTLELWYDGRLIAQQGFSIIGRETKLSQGNWKNALMRCNHNVTHYYDNGTYKGQTKDGDRSGEGMYAWNSGDYYIGHFLSGVKHGLGIYIVDEGQVRNCPRCMYYVGDWYSGSKSGSGTCYDRLGNLLYYGEFNNDKPTGTYPTKGGSNYKFEYFEYSNGDSYLGETMNGIRQGMGIYIWANGNMWYGAWANGERTGNGLFMDYEGNTPVVR